MSSVYPKLATDNDKVSHMQDKKKQLKDKLDHYRKLKRRWSKWNTGLTSAGIVVSVLLAGASILTITPFSLPLAAAILGGCGIGNAVLTNSAIQGYTQPRKKKYQQKCEHINKYLNKMDVFFVKCMEDKEISVEEFEMFQKLWQEYENTATVSSPDRKIQKIDKKAKKDF